MMSAGDAGRPATVSWSVSPLARAESSRDDEPLVEIRANAEILAQGLAQMLQVDPRPRKRGIECLARGEPLPHHLDLADRRPRRIGSAGA